MQLRESIPVGRLVRPQDVDSLQAAHVHHNPENIGLPHKQRGGAEDHGPQVINVPGRVRTEPKQMVPVGNKDDQG